MCSSAIVVTDVHGGFHVGDKGCFSVENRGVRTTYRPRLLSKVTPTDTNSPRTVSPRAGNLRFFHFVSPSPRFSSRLPPSPSLPSSLLPSLLLFLCSSATPSAPLVVGACRPPSSIDPALRWFLAPSRRPLHGSRNAARKLPRIFFFLHPLLYAT